MPAGVAKHFAFMIPSDAVDAARAKLFVADQRLAGPLAICPEGGYPIGERLKLMGKTGVEHHPMAGCLLRICDEPDCLHTLGVKGVGAADNCLVMGGIPEIGVQTQPDADGSQKIMPAGIIAE